MNDENENIDILGLEKDGYTQEQIESMLKMDERLQKNSSTVENSHSEKKNFIPGENLSPSQRKIVEMILLVEVMIPGYNKNLVKISTHLHTFKNCLAREYVWLDYNIKKEWNKKLKEENLNKAHGFETKIKIKKFFIEEKIVKWFNRWDFYYKKTKDERFNILVGFLKDRYYNLRKNRSPTISKPISDS